MKHCDVARKFSREFAHILLSFESLDNMIRQSLKGTGVFVSKKTKQNRHKS